MTLNRKRRPGTHRNSPSNASPKVVCRPPRPLPTLSLKPSMLQVKELEAQKNDSEASGSCFASRRLVVQG